MSSRRTMGALALVAVLAVAGCSSSASDDAGGAAPPGSSPAGAPSDTSAPTTSGTVRPPLAGAVPTVTGPITGGTYGVPYNPMPEGLADEHGYVEEEHFISGTAESFVADGPLGTDGRWSVTPGESADYTTRIIVRRPADAADANGIVLVEWLNVSAGRDSDADFGILHPELLREGYAYVGVSAQATGVSGGPTRLEVPGVPPEAIMPLKEWDAERYAPLDHPGDQFSYDIFTQVARLVLDDGDTGVLGDLPVTHVVAMGESQSAGRMATYANAIQPESGAFDALFIHSRGSAAAPLNADATVTTPPGGIIRTDIGVPVLQFVTETDLLRLGFLAARQPDSEWVRTWEVAGTAHADQQTLVYGSASGRVWLVDSEGYDPSETCGQINDGPQSPVAQAALAALTAWMVDGTVPPTSPLIEVADGDIVTDATGNAVGGIRTPPVDAPTSVLTGKGNPASIFCSLFGGETPLTPEQLAARYATHDDYVAAVRTSAEQAVADGFLLPEDAEAMVAEAEAAAVPS